MTDEIPIAHEAAAVRGACSKKKLRGFAAMEPGRLAEVSAKGGRAVPAHKRPFACRPGYAALCGAKGGAAVAANKRTFSLSRDAAVAAGKKGAQGRRPKDEGKEHE